MKWILSLCLVLGSCATKEVKEEHHSSLFKDKRACFLLYNLKAQKLIKKTGDSCHEYYPACSTFKVPLSVMAFDSGILKNEEEILKWDGKTRFIDQWNRDQNARTWMQYSVVWFSQKLTPLLGEKRFQKYLNEFNYGNKDLRGGIREAWLVSPASTEPALKISPLQQLEFMKNLWRNKLPASERAQKITREIMFIETSPQGWKLNGKTGSGNFRDEDNRQLGWFISHISRGEEEYLAVTQFTDTARYEGQSFGGIRAKEITKRFLLENGLW